LQIFIYIIVFYALIRKSYIQYNIIIKKKQICHFYSKTLFKNKIASRGHSVFFSLSMKVYKTNDKFTGLKVSKSKKPFCS